MKLKDIVPYCLDYAQKPGNGTYEVKYYWIIDGLTYTIDTLETKSPDFMDGLFDHKLHSDTINYIHLSRYNFINPHEKPNQYDARKNYLTLNLNNEITIHNNFIMVHKTENETTDSELDIFFKTNYYIANGNSASIQNYTVALFHPITHCMMVDLRTTVFKDLIVPPKPAELTLDEKVDVLIDELMKDSRTMAIKKLKRMLNERL